MREAADINDILNGYPVKEGKTLYARVTCPCCGRRWFPRADEEAYNVRFKRVGQGHGPGCYVCTVTCENCNCPVDDCEFVSEERLRESYKNFGKE